MSLPESASGLSNSVMAAKERAKEALEKALEAHAKAHPIPIIETLDGMPLTDKNGKPVKNAPTVDALLLDEDPREVAPDSSGLSAELESVA